MSRSRSSAERDDVVAAVLESAQLPGVLAATFHRGEIDWRCALGETARRYRIGSITKTFTAVAVLQLRDEGRLDLDDPIGKHLTDAPYTDRTIRHLLAHGSGMTAEPAGPWWERVPGGSWADLVAANAAAIDVFRPGQRHHYSNLGYGLLGELVARPRGCSWWEAVQRQLIEPLDLTETTYHPGSDDAAVGTSRNPETDRLMREPSQDVGAMAPAGQLWSTLDDLARWADFLATGRDGVLGADTLVEMRSAQAADPDQQHRGAYGLGLRLRWTATGTLVGHTGSMPGFLAGLFVDPISRVGGVLLTNATTGFDPESVVAELQCLAAVEVESVSDDAVAADEELDELVGTWYWGNTAMQLEPTTDGFMLVEKATRRGFRAEDVDIFRGTTGYWAGERLDVHRRDDGSVAYLEVVTFILTRTPYEANAPVPGGLPTPL